MQWIPRFIYGATEVTLSLPMTLWRHGGHSTGGRERTAGGRDAAWLVDRARRLAVGLRFDATEWPAVRAFLEYAQTGASVTFDPDSAGLTPQLEPLLVQLEAPTIEDGLQPTPDSNYPRVLALAIVLRRSDGLGWPLAYFEEEVPS
jgi:hypothetical protein